MIRCIVIGILLLAVVGFFAYGWIADLFDGNGEHCSCIGYECGCCAQLRLKSVVDGKVCANFTYLPEPKYGIEFEMFYKNERKIEYEISLRNPPKICFEEPLYFDDAEIGFCLDFHDISVENQNFGGCLDVEFEFLRLFDVKLIHFGCFGSTTSPSIKTQLKNIYYYVTSSSKFNDTDVTQVVLK